MFGSGRALVELAAASTMAATGSRFKLDAEPDRDRFDVGARVISPADGMVPALDRDPPRDQSAIAGNGSWTRWRGKAALDLSGRRRRASRSASTAAATGSPGSGRRRSS